jgi:hypothetical protein
MMVPQVLFSLDFLIAFCSSFSSSSLSPTFISQAMADLNPVLLALQNEPGSDGCSGFNSAASHFG